MLAVTLTKSFRCSCFTLKCTYPYFCVYLICFWYSLCVDCLQALCCQQGLSKGTKATRRHWSYANWNQSLFVPAMQFKGAVNNIPPMRMSRCVSVFVVHTSQSVVCKEEEKEYG